MPKTKSSASGKGEGVSVASAGPNNAGGCLGLLIIAFVALLVIRPFSCVSDDALRLSVSTTFTRAVDSNEPSEFELHGSVFHEAEPVSGGVVALEVVRVNSPRLTQSFLTQIDAKGAFALAGEAGLKHLRETDKIRVTASAESRQVATVTEDGDSEASGKLLTGTAAAYWNHEPPDALIGEWGPGLVMGLLFFVAIVLVMLFTGPYTANKSRCAFVVIYLIACMSLLAPFLALYYAESLADATRMAELPVGVLRVGTVGTEPAVELNQWSLNIGGVSTLSESGDGVYDVKNGLVVPLYVLVLAILGGAVNLLRKVPRLQLEIKGEFETQFRRVAWHKEPNKWLKGVRTLLAALGLVDITADDDVPESRPSDVDQQNLNECRMKLILQVLFHFMSPILGIVAYYGLMVIEPSLGSRTPFVVLFSFAVGLSTEGFLEAVAEWFDSMLGKLKSKAVGDKEEPRPRNEGEAPAKVEGQEEG